MLMMTTSNEEWWDENESLPAQCFRATLPLGLTSARAFNACLDRYNATFLSEINMRVSYESMHAEAFLTALVNTRKSGQSYVGEFELTNYSNHANDMYFFIGLHPIIMNRTDVQLMDKYYPQMIKNFVRGKAPDPTWKPQNWNGRNYFRITYNVSENGTLSDWPHNVDGYQDLAGLNFWLREMPEVERNASKAAEKAGEEEQSWQYVFEPKEQGEDQNVLEKAQDLEPEQNQKNQNQNGVGRRFPILSALPPPLEMLDTPFDHNDTTISDTMDGTSTSTTESLETTGAGGILDGTTNVTTVSTPYTDELVDPTVADTSEATVIPRNESAGIGEIRKVWSAFWLTLTVAILLAIAVVIMAATKLIHRHENQHGGYSYNSGPVRDTSDFFFTEKSRIIGANDANSARYQ